MNEQWQKRFAEATEYGVFEGPFGMAISRMVELGVADEEIHGLAEGLLDSFERDRNRGRVAPFAAPLLKGGELMLGSDDRGNNVSIDPGGLCAHAFLLGGSGAGKTTLLLFVLLQLLGHVPGIWLADLRKKDLRQLLPLAHRKSVPLAVVPLHRARINPLEIEGADRQRLVSRRIRSLGTSLGLPSRGRAVFAGACWKLYRKFGVLDGRGSLFPTLFDVYNEIKADSSTNTQARHAVLDRLGGLLTELGPRVLAWRNGWKPSELARRAIVFEGGGLTERSVSLVIEHLLESRFMASVGVSNLPLNLLIALEDAQTLLSTGQEEGEVRVLDEMMALARGSGIGLMLMAQSVYGVSPHLLSNTATKVLGRVGHGGDVSSMGRAMGLTGEQIRWSMNHLRPGLMVAQVADPRHRRPFVLRVPPMSALPSVTEDEVTASVAPLEAMRTHFAEEFRDWTPEGRVEVRAEPNAPKTRKTASSCQPDPTPGINTESPSAQPLPEDAVHLLQTIDGNPGTPMSELGKLAGVSNRKLYALRKELLSLGLARTESLSVKSTGRPAVILVLTPEGKAVLSRAPQ